MFTALDAVRVAVALIVAAHPIYTLAHPELWADLHLPLPWLWLGVMTVTSLALLVPRLRVPAAIGTMIGLAVGIALYYPPPYWYVAGGAVVEGHPGSELNVLFIVVCAGIAVGGRRGLDIVRIGAALLLLAHPLHGFLAWDVDGMRAWGEAMESRGYPFGVPLVWGVITLQTLCSVALVANRFVILACLGHIAVLANGIAVVHWPAWFMVGPGENGMEMPLMYIVCFASVLVAKLRPAALPAAAVALFLVGCSRGETRWVATWTASPQEAAEPVPLHRKTLVQKVRVSVGGARVRVRLSNLYGKTPLHVGSAKVGETALAFGGHPDALIPPGAFLVSDAVALEVPALSQLAITLSFPDPTLATTEHSIAQATNSIGTTSWYFLTGVEVEAAARTVVAFGDSLTEGDKSTLDAAHRYTDFLAERLAGKGLAVVNQGIGGNCILRELLGESGLARLDRDALAQPGARTLLLLEGTNDLGVSDENGRFASAEEVIFGLTQLAERAHASGLRVVGATILPNEGSRSASAAREEKRQTVNRWIESSKVFDAVVDFDAAVRDPEHPSRLRLEFDSGDHSHPSDAGYRAMAEAVDPAVL